MKPGYRYNSSHIEKTSSVLSSGLSKLKAGGKGLWNFSFGGRTSPSGKWDPLYGPKSIGKVRQTHAVKAGDPLSGTRKFTPGGDEVFEGKRNAWKYLKQEMQGSRPSRADFHMSQLAKKVPLSASEQSRKGFVQGSKNMFGQAKDAPAGISVGAYQDRIRRGVSGMGADKSDLSKINNLSMMEFMKKHPGTAAKYYGSNALQKGFFFGFPGYEAYNIVANRRGPNPGEGMGSNLGTTIGSGLGWSALSPLGILGSTAAVGGVAAMSRGAGKMVDRTMKNRPLQARDPGLPITQNPVDSRGRHQLAR